MACSPEKTECPLNRRTMGKLLCKLFGHWWDSVGYWYVDTHTSGPVDGVEQPILRNWKCAFCSKEHTKMFYLPAVGFDKGAWTPPQ